MGINSKLCRFMSIFLLQREVKLKWKNYTTPLVLGDMWDIGRMEIRVETRLGL